MLAWLLLTLLPAALAVHQGALQIEVEGSKLDLHVVALTEKEAGLFSTSGNTLRLRWGGEVRGFLAAKAKEDMPPENYYNFTLLNKQLSYQVDVSQVGCSCNAALFFSGMPGYTEDGRMAHGAFNPWYCDANRVGGVWCWEQDSIEANRYAMATTPHECDAQPGGYIPSCSMEGCSTNSFTMGNTTFCPGNCSIDSRKPFWVTQAYEADAATGTKLVRMHHNMQQGDTTVGWSVCVGQHHRLQRMTPMFLADMKMVFQLWGDSFDRMAWLDSGTGCSGGCDREAAVATFANISISSLSSLPAKTRAPIVMII